MIDISIALFGITYCTICIMGFWRPGYHCAMIIGFLVAEQIFAYKFPSIYLSNRKIVDFAVGFTALLGLIWNRRLTFNSVAIPVWASGLLFFYAGLSVFWSPNFDEAFALYFEIIPLTILASFLAPLCIRRICDISDLINGILLIGLPSSLVFAFGERTGRSLALDEGNKLSELQPLASAQLAGYVVIFAATQVLNPTVSKWRIPYLIASMLFGLFTIASTSSRGQMLAIFPILLFAAAYTGRAFSKSTILALFVLVSLAFSSFWIIDKFELGWRWDESLVREGTMLRIEMIDGVFTAFGNGGVLTWLIGLGSSASFEIVGGYCHAVPVEVLCEFGLAGSILYTAHVYYSLRDGQIAIRGLKPGRLRTAVTATMAIGLYDFFLSMKQGSVLGGYTFGCLNILAMAALTVRASNALLDPLEANNNRQNASNHEIIHPSTLLQGRTHGL